MKQSVNVVLLYPGVWQESEVGMSLARLLFSNSYVLVLFIRILYTYKSPNGNLIP